MYTSMWKGLFNSKFRTLAISSVESQKGVIAVQRCSAENRKEHLWLSIMPFWLSTDDIPLHNCKLATSLQRACRACEGRFKIALLACNLTANLSQVYELLQKTLQACNKLAGCYRKLCKLAGCYTESSASSASLQVATENSTSLRVAIQKALQACGPLPKSMQACRKLVGCYRKLRKLAGHYHNHCKLAGWYRYSASLRRACGALPKSHTHTNTTKPAHIQMHIYQASETHIHTCTFIS